MKKFKIILAILLILPLLTLVNAVSAQQEATPTAINKVNHVANNFEKFQEKITLFLKFDTKDKANYYQYLAEKRLAELDYAIENKQVNLIETLASRYSTYLGNLTNFVIANKITGKKDDLTKMYDKHIAIIQQLQSGFEFESGWWLAIQHDINSAKIFKDKINSL